MKRKTIPLAFTLIELLVVITIIGILASIAVPVFGTVQERAAQTKDLNNAKQIGLACKVYAGDNDGSYPNKDVDGNALDTSNSANDFFRVLIPAYVPTEKIFFLAKSAWNTRDNIIQAPDEIIDTEANKLRKGENNFAYVTGLTDTSNPSFPLIADGFSGTVGTYETDETKVGGVWKGKKAVVIRVDMSGSVETVNSKDLTVHGKTGQQGEKNIFTSSNGWLGTTQKPVNPL